MWVEDTEVDINDLVQFRTVVTAQQGAKGYVLHDVMERGLEFVKDGAMAATNSYVAGTEASVYGLAPQVFLVGKRTVNDAETSKVWYVPATGKTPTAPDGITYGLTGRSGTPASWTAATSRLPSTTPPRRFRAWTTVCSSAPPMS